MVVWFIQGFVKELKIIYAIGEENKVEEFSVDPPFEIEDIVKMVEKHMRNEEVIKTVVLKGRSTILNQLDKYYTRIGVDVKWQ